MLDRALLKPGKGDPQGKSKVKRPTVRATTQALPLGCNMQSCIPLYMPLHSTIANSHMCPFWSSEDRQDGIQLLQILARPRHRRTYAHFREAEGYPTEAGGVQARLHPPPAVLGPADEGIREHHCFR